MRKEWSFRNDALKLAIEANCKKFVTNGTGYLIKEDKLVIWFGALIFRVELEIARGN